MFPLLSSGVVLTHQYGIAAVSSGFSMRFSLIVIAFGETYHCNVSLPFCTDIQRETPDVGFSFVAKMVGEYPTNFNFPAVCFALLSKAM